jgi:hypothetical protein
MMDCLACGITSSLVSREHVFSDWLLREFDPEVSMSLFRMLGDGTRKQARVEIKLASFKLKDICDACNNGWMSNLEIAAKPLILALIRGTLDLANLTDDERRTIAKWAGKTAIIESHSVGAECPVEKKYLRFMRTSEEVPGRFAVAACRTELVGFGHMQVGIIRDLIGGGKAAGNIIMIALPKLAFACAFPMLETPYECRCVKSLYVPLWPHPASWRDMNQTAMTQESDDVETLAAMAERIELFHKFT